MTAPAIEKTAIETPRVFASLGARFAGTNVEAIAGDATTLPHEAERR